MLGRCHRGSRGRGLASAARVSGKIGVPLSRPVDFSNNAARAFQSLNVKEPGVLDDLAPGSHVVMNCLVWIGGTGGHLQRRGWGLDHVIVAQRA